MVQDIGFKSRIQFLKRYHCKNWNQSSEAGSITAVGMTFFPKNKQPFSKNLRSSLNQIIEQLDFELIRLSYSACGWDCTGSGALEVMPDIGSNLFVKHKKGLTGIELERKLYSSKLFSSEIQHQNSWGKPFLLFLRSLEAARPWFQRALPYRSRFYHFIKIYKTQRKNFFPPGGRFPPRAFAIIATQDSRRHFPNWRLAAALSVAFSHNGENKYQFNVIWIKWNQGNLMKSKFFSPMRSCKNAMRSPIRMNSVQRIWMRWAELAFAKWKKSTTCDDDARNRSLADNEVHGPENRKAFINFLHASSSEALDGPALLTLHWR